MSEANGRGGIDISKAAEVTKREDEGIVVHIRDEKGEPQYLADGATPINITIAGKYSKRYKKASQAVKDRLLRQSRNRLTGELVDDQSIEILAACVIAWTEGGFTNGSEPFPCNKPNALHLLTVAPWIFEQLEEAQNDHAAFFATASTPSSSG